MGSEDEALGSSKGRRSDVSESQRSKGESPHNNKDPKLSKKGKDSQA
jgi:hypothetical protein